MTVKLCWKLNNSEEVKFVIRDCGLVPVMVRVSFFQTVLVVLCIFELGISLRGVTSAIYLPTSLRRDMKNQKSLVATSLSMATNASSATSFCLGATMSSRSLAPPSVTADPHILRTPLRFAASDRTRVLSQTLCTTSPTATLCSASAGESRNMLSQSCSF